MNYLEQIKGFWITQEINQLGSSEIAMYFYFLEVWNKTAWVDGFKRNNYKVMADLSIKSPKTLQSIRDKLQTAGVFQFQQKNGDANVQYWMCDLGKIYQGSGKGSVEGLGKGSGKGSGIVNINETKPNQTNPVVPAPPPPPVKNNSGKNQKEGKPEPHWEVIVEIWFNFNREKFGDEPSFTRDEPRILKRIVHRLKKRAEKTSVEWTEQAARERFKNFLVKCYGDQWLATNFLLSNLEKQFDKIILNHNGNKHQGTAGKTVSTGRTLVRDAL